MLNLTSSPIMLLTAEGPSGIVLQPAPHSAREHILESYLLSGKHLHAGASAMHSATLQPPSAEQIVALNRFLQHEIARDRAENGGDGLVLVDRAVLYHVEPQLAPHVAEPHPDAMLAGKSDPIQVSLLIHPPSAPKPKPGPTDSNTKRYTLYHDRAGGASDNPATDTIGHADTWEQLQWMARGAAAFEHGGRIWALNNRTSSVLYMADIQLDGDPEDEQPDN